MNQLNPNSMSKHPYTEPQIKVVRFAVELGTNLSSEGTQAGQGFETMQENTESALSGSHFTQI